MENRIRQMSATRDGISLIFFMLNVQANLLAMWKWIVDIAITNPIRYRVLKSETNWWFRYAIRTIASHDERWTLLPIDAIIAKSKKENRTKISHESRQPISFCCCWPKISRYRPTCLTYLLSSLPTTVLFAGDHFLIIFLMLFGTFVAFILLYSANDARTKMDLFKMWQFKWQTNENSEQLDFEPSGRFLTSTFDPLNFCFPMSNQEGKTNTPIWVIK